MATSSSETYESLGFSIELQLAIREVGEQGLAEPRFRNLRVDGAIWLAKLVLHDGVHEAVELGTSNGFSTLHIGGALAQTGGHLTSYEKYAERADLARSAIHAAGLSEFITIVTDDGVTALQERDTPIDLLFMDIWPADYILAVQHARRLLSSGSLIVVDNLIDHRDRSGAVHRATGSGANEYIDFINSLPGYLSEPVDMGSGMMLTRVP